MFWKRNFHLETVIWGETDKEKGGKNIERGGRRTKADKKSNDKAYQKNVRKDWTRV